MMFKGASSANPHVSNWDVSKVNDMTEMFAGSGIGEVDLRRWDMRSAPGCYNMFLRCNNSVGDRRNRCRLRIFLPIQRFQRLHFPFACLPQLNPGERMDRVIDTAMARDETAQHRTVRSVDDRVDRQPRDIPLPDRQHVCERIRTAE